MLHLQNYKSLKKSKNPQKIKIQKRFASVIKRDFA